MQSWSAIQELSIPRCEGVRPKIGIRSDGEGGVEKVGLMSGSFAKSVKLTSDLLWYLDLQ